MKRILSSLLTLLLLGVLNVDLSAQIHQVRVGVDGKF